MTGLASQPFAHAPFRTELLIGGKPRGRGLGPGETVTKQKGSDPLILLRHLLLWVPAQHTVRLLHCQRRNVVHDAGEFLKSDEPVVALSPSQQTLASLRLPVC
jgi:hypothetical protein